MLCLGIIFYPCFRSRPAAAALGGARAARLIALLELRETVEQNSTPVLEYAKSKVHAWKVEVRFDLAEILRT